MRESTKRLSGGKGMLYATRMSEKIRKDDAEWRKKLTDEQYHVTRQKGTEPPFTGEYESTDTKGTYKCVCCGQPLFSFRREVPFGFRLAELLSTGRRKERGSPPRHQPRHGAHGSGLQQLRRAPGARFRGWSEAHGLALLHQFGCAEAGRRQVREEVLAALTAVISHRDIGERDARIFHRPQRY